MSFYWWFLFFIAIVCMFIFVPFTLRIKLHNVREDSSVFLMLKVMLFRRIPLLKVQRTLGLNKSAGSDSFFLIKLLKRSLFEQNRLPRGKQVSLVSGYLLRVGAALEWHEMMVLLRVGTGDAASAGINIGLLRSLGGVLSHILWKKWRFREKKPLILTYPYFLESKIKFHITAECSTGLAQLLYRVLFPSQKNKEVIRRWQKNIPFKP